MITDVSKQGYLADNCTLSSFDDALERLTVRLDISEEELIKKHPSLIETYMKCWSENFKTLMEAWDR